MLTSTKSTHLFNSFAPSWADDLQANLVGLTVLAAFVIVFALEARFGYRPIRSRLARQSYLTNLGTFLMNDTLMSLMSVSSILVLAEHYGRWGLLRLIPEPAVGALLSLLLLDLTLYLWHRANHTFDCLWIFHKVHHSDPSMNVTTAFRLHFVEVVLTTAVKAAFVVLMGVEASVMMANEALITLLVMFHHANLRFKGERLLGRFFIVPYLHRAHHSVLRREHDNNYGAVFSIWDRVFGTLLEKEPERIGLESTPGMGVLELVKYGLSTSWLPSSKTVLPSPQFVQRMIAEAAYYRAKERGFAPGNETLDWLEAERDILSRFRTGKPNRSFPCICK